MQVQLSNRLQAVVELVTKGNTVADVGCDHAYISIYMVKEKIASKVIAMDVNKGPLQRAKENIEKYLLAEEIETRLSNGIEKLHPGEVQTVLIAGMGGPLMQKILLGNKAVLDTVSELVLQPQSEIPEVRHFLETIGFSIQTENMVKEDGKYYTMMLAKRTSYDNTMEKEIFYRYGKNLLLNQNQVLKEYLEKEVRVSQSILEKLSDHTNERTAEKRKEIEENIDYCKEALAYYED